MELKLQRICQEKFPFVLLIVPYGIETSDIFNNWIKTELLIVPYGIETRQLEYMGLQAKSFNRTLWN